MGLIPGLENSKETLGWGISNNSKGRYPISVADTHIVMSGAHGKEYMALSKDEA